MNPMEPRRITRAHWLVLLAAFLGWLFDGFEMGLFPVVARPALLNFAPAGDDGFVGRWMGWITAAFLIGAACGGFVFGWLGDRIGRVRAMELMLLGERLYGRQALEWGLVNRVVPDDEVESTAMALAKELAEGARSLGIIKHVAWAGADLTLEEALTHERLHQREACRTEDFLEGINAFAEKRAPAFKGK